MKANLQKSFDVIKEELRQKLINADEANVRMVLASRYKIVTNKIPSQVRKALMQAVKEGRLKRSMKKGITPEYFYHPNWEHLALEEVNKIELNKINALKNILGSNK